jgi:signal transduction histidine kinase/ActR/RegA family two-component response regulator
VTDRAWAKAQQTKPSPYALVFSAVSESTHDGILAVAPNGKVIYANSRFREIWSIPDEIMDTGDDQKLIECVISQLVDPQGFVERIEELHRSSDKSQDVVEFRDGRVLERWSSPLVGDRRLEGRVWFFKDITERRQADEALLLDESRLQALLVLNQMSEASLQQITDFALESAVQLTKSKIGYLSFLNENESVLTMYSWSRTAMQQCKILDKPLTYPVETTGLWGEAVRQRRPVITNDYKAPNPLKRGYPEGHVYVLRHMNVPVFDGERIVVVAGVGNKDGNYDETDVRQLTLLMQGMWKLIQRKQADEEHRRLQAQLTQSQKMEAVGRLAGGVAHDLNNVLGPMVALPDLIQFHLRNAINGDARAQAKIETMLNTVRVSAERAAVVVRDLVALSRGGRYEHEPADINYLLQQWAKGIHAADLRKSYPGAVIEHVLADETLVVNVSTEQILRVIQNLTQNAAEALVGDGNITVVASRQAFRDVHEGYCDIPVGDYAVIEVSDNGAGIEPGNMDRIFEPFFTAKSPGERKGSGLGLSVVHGVVEEHGGYLDLTSESGRGTSVFVYLPLATLAESQKDPGEQEPLFRGTESILVVDDEPAQRYIAVEALTRSGYTVDTVIDGNAAVRQFHKHSRESGATSSPYDLVLLDMIMDEGFDGLDTYRAILKNYPEQKVIIASGHAESGRAQVAVELGAGWLAKPYGVHALNRAVRQKLDEEA